MQHAHHHSQHNSEHESHGHKGHQQPVAGEEAHKTYAHDKHAGHHTHDFLKRFWICLIVTVPILLLSHMIQQWFNFHISFPGDKYLLLGFGTFIYLYGGWPFLTGMFREIRHSAIGMMTLVAIAISVAYIYSAAVIFGLEGMDFFWELATLVDIMLLGHWLEMRSQMAASRALQTLVELLPSIVHVEQNGSIVDKNLKELRSGDVVLIKPGEKVPADGHVIDGTSYVNESMLTGESVPVKKEKGTTVIAGALNGDGAIKVHVSGVGADSYLNKVIELVRSAQNAKSRTQNLADKVAKWLTIISIFVGVATFIYWFSKDRDLAFSLERLVTVMVTACPHALGVAIPLVVAISSTKAAMNGLLIRNRTAFEDARKLTTIIFDKTGTLTKGSHEVQTVKSLSDSYSEDQVLELAASVQQHSEHYIARGMIKKLKERDLKLKRSENFEYTQGVGVSAQIGGDMIIVAGPNYFTQNGLSMPSIPENIDRSSETISFVLVNKNLVGIITLSDTIRKSSFDAIHTLKKMNIKTYLLTGDNDHVASAVAGKLNMDGYLANVLPHQKQDKVAEFQKKGEIVAMTGDGVNDAPALAQADVGIAVGSGTDVAAETADIILVNSDPIDVVKMVSFGRRTFRKMVENLFWAVGYNVVAIPLAAGVLYPKFILSPALGAVLMSLSTIIVAINAKLLRLK